MKNSIKILFTALLILNSNSANAKISDDLRQGAKELKLVPSQMLAIPQGISSMYQDLRTTKNEIQEKIQEINNAKNEVADIKKLLNEPQIKALPPANRETIQIALDALSKDDGSGALDNLQEVLVGIKKRMNAIIETSPKTIGSITNLTIRAAGKINNKKLGKTLPQRMEAVSNILDNFGL